MKKILSVFFLILSDLASLLAAFMLGYFLRSQILPHVISFKQPPLPLSSQLSRGFFVGVFIVITILAFERLYTKRVSFWEEAKLIIRGITLGFILMAMIVFVSRSYTQFSRIVTLLAWLLSLAIFPIFRLMAKKALLKINLWEKKVLIIGTNQTAKMIAQAIKNDRTLGYEISGFLAEDPSEVGRVIVDDKKVIGTIDQVEDVSKEFGVQDIIIALPGINQDKLIDLMETCEKVTSTIRIVPAVGSLFTMGVEIENFGDILSLSITRNLAKPWNIFIKKSFELALALVLLILFFPILLLIAIAIKFSSPGPVLFRQERLIANDKKIKIFKFRSMFIDGDAKLNDYLKQNPEAQAEWTRYQKIKNNDPRVTRMGKFIRRHSLDELPQLLNVLKGEMSLVGPRPYLPREKKELGERYQIICRVKPGITGLWQVSGRNLLLFEDRFPLDEYYIRNWSLWLDVVILFKTIRVLAKHEGAY
jgi:undecaprenyl-phosphate galactose phosphotransferase